MTTANDATVPAVGRVPIPVQAVDTLRQRLRELCQEIATGIVDAEDESGLYAGQNPTERSVARMVTVAEAMALETVQLQRWLWDEAARRGVSVSAVARARGVTQQAQQGVMARRAQQR